MKTNEELFNTWRDTFHAKQHLSTEAAVEIWQRTHEFTRTLPDDVQCLLYLKEVIDRECTKGVRCGVCGAVADPGCAEGC